MSLVGRALRFLFGPVGRRQRMAGALERAERSTAELAGEAARTRRVLSSEPIVRTAEEAVSLFERRVSDRRRQPRG